MKFTDLVHPANLRSAMEAKLVNARPSGDGQTIYNYSDAAMWTPGAWDNPAVRQCRGLIVDEDGYVAARPWAKFFNHGQAEAGALDLDAPVEVTDKLDGSLGILHKAPDGRPRVATRGSFTSDQAVHATAVLRERYPAFDWSEASLTPLVEIVYPANRIVCDYGDTDDLILLGGVDPEDGDYYSPVDVQRWTGWRGPVADVMPYRTLRDALAAPPRPGMEGLCVRYLDQPHIVKIKQEDYVALHRIVTGLSERTVWQHMVDGKPLTDLLDGIPDELLPWVRDVWGRIEADADSLELAAQERHEQILAALDPEHTRGEYAALAKGSHLTPYLFNLLDGRSPRGGILKTLRPVGDTRAKAFSEDVA